MTFMSIATKTLYDTDFVEWTARMAELLRERVSTKWISNTWRRRLRVWDKATGTPCGRSCGVCWHIWLSRRSNRSGPGRAGERRS